MANFKKKLIKMLEDEAVKAIRKGIVELNKRIPAEEPKEDNAFQALIGLGYSTTDAHRALQGVSIKLSTQDRVKAALKNL